MAARANRGIALISVLWITGLLAVMAASFASSTRTETRLAHNQEENAERRRSWTQFANYPSHPRAGPHRSARVISVRLRPAERARRAFAGPGSRPRFADRVVPLTYPIGRAKRQCVCAAIGSNALSRWEKLFELGARKGGQLRVLIRPRWQCAIPSGEATNFYISIIAPHPSMLCTVGY